MGKARFQENVSPLVDCPRGDSPDAFGLVYSIEQMMMMVLMMMMVMMMMLVRTVKMKQV